METKGNKAAKHLKPGDTCWIIENNLYAVCGTIKSANGSFYTIILKNGSAVRLKAHRVFETQEEAESRIIQHTPKRPAKTPYDYWH